MAQLPILGCVESENQSISFRKRLSFPRGVRPGFLIPSLEDSPSVPCLLWWFLVSAWWWVHLWTQGSSPCSNCLEYSLLPRGRTFPDIYSHRKQSLCPRCSKHSKTPPSVLLFFSFFFFRVIWDFCLFLSYFLFTWLLGVLAAACGPVPWPRIEPRRSALGAWSLGHWTAREAFVPLLVRHVRSFCRISRCGGFTLRPFSVPFLSYLP